MRYKMYLTVIKIGLLTCVLSCGKKAGFPFSGNQDSASGQAEEAGFEVKEQLLPLPEVGHYTYQLSWSGTEGYTDIELFRFKANFPEEKVASVSNSFQDPALKSGELWNYRLEGTFEGKKYTLFESQVLIPKDLEVSGDLLQTESFISPGGRLFLKENATLRTGGRSVKIEVNEVHSSPGSKIDTTPEKVQADRGEQGQLNGFVWLKANTLSGDLNILSRGQKGGDGVPGIPGSRGADGGPGRNAVLGLCYSGRPDKYGATGGGAGEAGGTGGSGGPGQKGSDSSLVRVEYNEISNGKVTIDSQPGEGGAGGPGGPGGEGGNGGKGGLGAGGNGQCPKGADGAKGARGPDGPQGPAGIKGQVGEICVIGAGTSIQGNCESFPELKIP